MARLQGLSIGIVGNNRVRAVTTIAYCATDVLAKVHIDRYLGYQQNLKMTSNQLSFEQYLSIATNQHLLVKSDRCAMISIDTYCSCDRFARVSIDANCPI